MSQRFLVIAAACLVTACQSGSETAVPGDANDHQPFAQIGPDEVLHFTGTEPFWGGEATGASLTYQTPEDSAGATVQVERFAGRGGLALSGTLNGKPMDMMVTPGNCSDGMSDRTYPFVVTLKIGGETRNGCGWTDRRQFLGPDRP